MKLVILESPYAGDIEKNVEYARRCMRHSIDLGEAPIASHLLYTQKGILDDSNAHERRLGMDAGLAWLERADYSVYYTDLGWSSGMLDALHNHTLKKGLDFRIRSLYGKPRIPATLHEEIEDLLRSKIDA